MKRALRFSPAVQFGTLSTRARLLSDLFPCVRMLASLLRQGTSFADGVSAALSAHPRGIAEFVVEPGAIASTFGLHERHLVPEANPDIEWLVVRNGASGAFRSLRFPGGAHQPELADVFSALAGPGLTPHAGGDSGAAGAIVEFLARVHMVEEFGVAASPARFHAEGIHRLQHASVLVRTRTTGILVDPHFHSLYESGVTRGIGRGDLEGLVDVILITHSHADHFHLPTLMTFPRGTPVVVPHVPRQNLLCDDLAGRLRGLGFTNVIAPAWHAQSVRVGDAAIHVLPFFGEQPLVEGALRHPALRSWGNTYLVETPAFTAWLLADAGNDALGHQREVAEQVTRRFGGVEFLLSNLRPFAIFTPGYITGNGAYWHALPPEWMARFHLLGHDCVTLGPRGVAEVCDAARARFYLPYAHWFADCGQRGEGEERLLALLARELTDRGSVTRIVDWRIGDTCRVPVGGDAEVGRWGV